MALAMLILVSVATALLLGVLIALVVLMRRKAPPPIEPASPEALAATERRVINHMITQIGTLDMRDAQRGRSQREELAGALKTRFEETSRLLDKHLADVRVKLQSLGDLNAGILRFNRLLSNVKARGTWGEVLLDKLLEDMLAPAQFARNVKPNPRSQKIVEFALVLPGVDHSPLYIPIDSKFPIEDYERLLGAQDEAQESAARAALITASRTFVQQVGGYITPPYTTDFAVLFVPVEGLYLELAQQPQFMAYMREHKVLLAGPSTLPALLNALQMGFKTLAVQKHTSQVWTLLMKVKGDVDKYFNACDILEKRLNDAQLALQDARERLTQMNKKLCAAQLPEGIEEFKHA